MAGFLDNLINSPKIRRNVFWALIAIAIVAIIVVYFSFSGKMRSDIDSYRTKVRQNNEQLQAWAAKKGIPNDEMIKAVIAEQEKLQNLYGQLMLLYVGRSIDVKPLIEQSGRIDAETREYLWWNEYEKKTAELVKSTRQHFGAPEDVLVFEKRPPALQRDEKRIIELETIFRKTEYFVNALETASPKNAPLIDKLFSIRLSGTTSSEVLKHPWIQTTPVTLHVQMLYENLPVLVAKLQDYCGPIAVSSCDVKQPALMQKRDEVSGAAKRAVITDPIVDVTLTCEMVEFLPVIETVEFSGEQFGSPAAVKAWLQKEDRNLHSFIWTLADQIPPLKARLEAALLKPLDGLRQEGNKYPNNVFDSICGFSYVYPQLYPVIPQKAYFAGNNANDRKFLVVQMTEAGGKGRWVVADYSKAAVYTKNKDGSDVTFERMEKLMLSERLTGIRVSATLPVIAVYSDSKDVKRGPIPMRVLFSEAQGTWRVCPVVQVSGEPLAVSDNAFRMSSVIHRAAANIDSAQGAPLVLKLVPEASVQKNTEKTFTISVQEEKRGTIKAIIGLKQ